MKYQMIGALISFLLLSCSAHSEDPVNILILEFTLYKNDSVAFSDYFVDTGMPTVFESANTGYRITVYSKEKSALYDAFFRPGLEAMASGTSITPAGSQDAAYLRLRLPYKEQMTSLEIYHAGKKIHALDLSLLCDHNGKCDGRENALSCPSDCGEGRGKKYCSTQADGVCDGSCFSGWDPDCANGSSSGQKNPAESPSKDYSVYLAVTAGVLIVLSLFLFRRRLALTASFFMRRAKKQ